MASFTVVQWEIMADVVSICFFGITLLLLIIMTFKHRRISPKQVAAENRVGFNEALAHVITKSEKEDEHNRISHERSADRYQDVEKLANSGLSADEISRRANIPKSEIELIVRLNKFGPKPHMKNR